MVELELVNREVQLIRSCLKFRMMEIRDDRQDSYARQLNGLTGIGLFRFNSFEVACIVLSLVEFSSCAGHIGHTALAEEALRMAELVHWRAYSRPLGELPQSDPERSICSEMAVLACVS